MRLQITDPADHPHLVGLPFELDLGSWELADMHGVLGLHRHVVRLVEVGPPNGKVSYVVKELPDHLAQREFRLLRSLSDDRLPTVLAVAVATERAGDRDGLLVTRHLDYSLPYRSLLAGRGLTIPYLGDRMLDALVGLLVRLHLAGFYWGDCSLSNTLFRRDAGELSAYIIDVETSERHPSLTAGQRKLDLQIAAENLAGGLLDLREAGRLAVDIDPWQVSDRLLTGYDNLWDELTGWTDLASGDTWKIEERVRRLHELGFDVHEMEVVTAGGTDQIRAIPRVVESGYHQERLLSLTGLWAGENQARRLLGDIGSFGAELAAAEGRPVPENIAAVRWLDRRFEPTIARIPPHLMTKLQAAEMFHQILEHRWFLSEAGGCDVSLDEAIVAYIDDVLDDAPDEFITLDPPTTELPLVDTTPDPAGTPAVDRPGQLHMSATSVRDTPAPTG